MAPPPVSALFEPVTCMPAWVAKYAALPKTTVRSGCAINMFGNVACKPEEMAAAAARAIGRPVSLQAYTLARYMQSEVGSGPIPERAAVGLNAINRVRYVENLGGDVNRLLLYRQQPGHPNRGFYGPIHGGGDLSAPYGRWAATTRDPTVQTLILAIDLLDGTVPEEFAKGADDQNGPEVFIQKRGMAYAIANVRSRAASRKYWVGPLPGVNHLRTMQYRYLRDVPPDSQLGRQLIARAIAAVQGPKPDWSKLPDCTTGKLVDLGDGVSPAVIAGAAAGAAAFIAGAALLRRHLRRTYV